MSTTVATFTVQGKAVTQGNHAVSRAGRIYDKSGPQLRAWREAITWEARGKMRARPAVEGPVGVRLEFVLPAPKRKVRAHPITKPDIDKLTRAALDALTAARVYVDDAQVIDLHVTKSYGDPCMHALVVAL